MLINLIHRPDLRTLFIIPPLSSGIPFSPPPRKTPHELAAGKASAAQLEGRTHMLE